MKHDQEKPGAIDFYWEGVKRIVNRPFMAEIIDDFVAFGHNPTIETLREFFVSTQELGTSDYSLNDILRDVSHVYYHGANKYGDKNYLGLTVDRIIHAIGRHLIACALGGRLDKDSGHPHIAHLFANILIAAELLSP